MKSFCIVFICFAFIKADSIDSDELKCLVCKASLKEFDLKVKSINPVQKIDIGGYQIDAEGNLKQERIALSKSETHLSELIDDVCDKMDDYVRGTYKKNGTLTIIKIVDDSGGMNPLISELNLIQDDDLNKSLKFYCEEVMSEYEEAIIKQYQNDVKNVPKKICNDISHYCDIEQRKPRFVDEVETDFLRDEF